MALDRLRIVVFPETTKTWTARFLEHDIAAGGRTVDAAIDTLMKVAAAHIAYDVRHGRTPLSAFAAAPLFYWSAFADASKLPSPLEIGQKESGKPVRCLVGVASQHPIFSRHPRPVRSA